MGALLAKENIWYVGTQDPNLRVFDIIMHSDWGTSYNAYLVKGSEKTALFETSKLEFFDEFLANVREVCDPASIDYIVVDHTEPDHTGSMEKLLELAPNIRLIKDDNVQDDLISGEVSAAVMYTSQVTMACMANPELKVVYPSEGVGFGIMAQFIPSNAPNKEAAYAFLDYILRPEVSKQCYEYIGYYCTNQAADELIEEEYKPFLTLPEDFSGQTEMIQNVSAEAEEAHVQVWTEFKAACGQ